MLSRPVASAAGVCCLLALGWHPVAAQPAPEEGWRLQAVRYARSERVAATRLVRDAPATEHVSMAWYFFVVQRGMRTVLIDVGSNVFTRPAGAPRARHWGVVEARTVEQALSATGAEPSDVTDVVLTHHHWDHSDALMQFRHATLHTHRGTARRLRLTERWPRPRLRTFAGEDHTVAPGLRLHRWGRHTAHHLVVRVRCSGGEWLLAGDAAYLFRNLEELRPVAVSVDPRRNLRDLRAMIASVGLERVLPGHDPLIFERFSTQEGVADICPASDP